MKRVYNFSAGPSMLPQDVLERAAAEMLDVNNTGQSAMEMSHRSGDFLPVIEKTESLLREILAIPDNYRVLFLQGGAMMQFAMIPINIAGVSLGGARKTASYIDTGVWASKAIDEAGKYVKVRVAASSKDKNYTYIPDAPAPQADDAYYYICYNNTIFGTKWQVIPETGNTPLIADVSSCIASEPLDVSRFGLLFAGAQKNLGPAGCTIVIIRDDLIGAAPEWTPAMLRYDIFAKEKSLFNTPPCYCIYMIGLVLDWVKSTGGIDAMAERNRKKAALLYDCLDASRLFRSPVEKSCRSLMNVTFVINDDDAEKRGALEKLFLRGASERGLVNLAGHRLVGGLRASIYNAMPREGVEALVSFIKQFEKNTPRV
ncbi:MAG: 3-phosphoserine/phosphohydroxythreonine transaminase [Spirochaetaceae bacterium]|jgi:phosphoserine aminotransferase|nr:3-phosphoserine/phosphohydroxythreonine transaminase [Spirochaetaceae bacterium]